MNLKTPNLFSPLKRLSISSDAAKTLALVFVLVLLAVGLVYFGPVLIEHMWNDFFHALFGWNRMYYDNAVALVFWMLVCIAFLGGIAAVVVNRPDEKGKK